MGYLLFAILFIIIVIASIAFFSKKEVEGSDAGAGATKTPEYEKEPNEEFIGDDPTHRAD